jgi:hypothetical protein
LIVFAAYSCKIDNYDAPDATFSGIIADPSGKGLQLEQGASSARIKMEELSWSKTPIPFYLNFKQNGTFINTKLFPGRYAITPVEGPFYPVAADTVAVSNSMTHNFTVTPYLNVSWVGEPTLDANKMLTAKFKFVRNASPIAGVVTPSVLDYQLYISTNEYVGNNNFDANAVGVLVAVSNLMENQELTITSKTPMKYSTKYFIRVGVRVNDNFKKYNYTDIKTVVVP